LLVKYRIERTQGSGDLIELIVKLYDGKLMEKESYRTILVAMSLTVKGLTKQEILTVVS